MVYGRYNYSSLGLSWFINQLITGGPYPVDNAKEGYPQLRFFLLRAKDLSRRSARFSARIFSWNHLDGKRQQVVGGIRRWLYWIHGGFHKWGRVYNGKSHENWRFGGTPILGNLHMIYMRLLLVQQCPKPPIFWWFIKFISSIYVYCFTSMIGYDWNHVQLNWDSTLWFLTYGYINLHKTETPSSACTGYIIKSTFIWVVYSDIYIDITSLYIWPDIFSVSMSTLD